MAVQHSAQAASLVRVRLADGEVLGESLFANYTIATRLTLVAKGRRLLMLAARTEEQAQNGLLIEFETESLDVLRELSVCAGHPSGIAVLNDIHRAYLRCTDADALVEVDLELGRVVQERSIPNPGCGDGGLAAEETGGRLFVPCSSSGRLLLVDRRSLAAFDSVAIGHGIELITVDRSARFAAISRPSVPEVIVVELAARRLHNRWPLAGPIKGLLLASGDNLVFGVINRSGTESEFLKLSVPDSLSLRPIEVAEVRSIDIWPRGQTPVFTWLK